MSYLKEKKNEEIRKEYYSDRRMVYSNMTASDDKSMIKSVRFSRIYLTNTMSNSARFQINSPANFQKKISGIISTKFSRRPSHLIFLEKRQLYTSKLNQIIKFQAIFRGYLYRMKTLREDCCIFIQSVIRSYLVRKRLKARKR